MKLQTLFSATSLACILFLSSYYNSEKSADNTKAKTPILKEEMVSYKVDSLNMRSIVVYDENIKGKSPAVLVIHEWW